jgi:tRNA-dihydrouridine synthase B
MKIGPYTLAAPLALAPMAGVTDRPFRELCRRLGAAWTPSEMVTADVRLYDTRKSRLRLDHRGEAGPRVVQIAGAEPGMLAEAARLNVELGAEVIDINMGCPAKKVCNRAAGSALLRDERLVADILAAVTGAVSVPVTLKIRTGWSTTERNAVAIARIAADCGIAALAVHGRTRADRFDGVAEYDTIAAVVAAVSIPVFANGDIDSAAKAVHVLEHTRAAGVMIGRTAFGFPWIFSEVKVALAGGGFRFAACNAERRDVILAHLDALHSFYGSEHGVRVARKHLGWYCDRELASTDQRRMLLAAPTASAQRVLAEEIFNGLLERNARAA